MSDLGRKNGDRVNISSQLRSNTMEVKLGFLLVKPHIGVFGPEMRQSMANR